MKNQRDVQYRIVQYAVWKKLWEVNWDCWATGFFSPLKILLLPTCNESYLNLECIWMEAKKVFTECFEVWETNTRITTTQHSAERRTFSLRFRYFEGENVPCDPHKKVSFILQFLSFLANVSCLFTISYECQLFGCCIVVSCLFI